MGRHALLCDFCQGGSNAGVTLNNEIGEFPAPPFVLAGVNANGHNSTPDE